MSSRQWSSTRTFVVPGPQREAVAELLAALESHESQDGTATIGLGASAKAVPDVVVDALTQVTRVLSHGRPVTVSEQEHLLTPHEAAALLGINRHELDILLESGELPFQAVGRHHRIAIADVLSRRRRADPAG